MTPETLNDMLLGYVVGLGILFVFVASIWWRYRGLAADEQAVEKLEVDIQQDIRKNEAAAASD